MFKDSMSHILITEDEYEYRGNNALIKVLTDIRHTGLKVKN